MGRNPKELRMTRFDLIKKLEEIDRQLLEEIDLETTDYAREHAHYSIEGAIDFLKENEE